MSDDRFSREAEEHDRSLRARSIDAWIGAEPTFTRRDSQHVAWLFEALGDDKEERARTMLRHLAPLLGAKVSLFAVEGRQYPGETAPRFSFAARWSRTEGHLGVAEDRLDAAPTEAPIIETEATSFLTLTPDPGVVEVNAAPCADLVSFLAQMRAVYAAAAAAGLSPIRYRYNGQVCDSGGGGQLSFGGPSAERSPFFVHGHLLPSFLRYVNRHPSISYAFAPPCIGSAGQGPRPDEGVRERFEELAVALDLIDAAIDDGAPPSPEQLWRRLSPLLVDGSGNSHRAEINIEKLWSPHLGARGKLGVVELRSLAMPETPERITALAALFRALIARFVIAPYREPLTDWGGSLHDRFALPTVLARDLAEVLDDLAAHDVGLGETMRAELTKMPEPIAQTTLDGAELSITPAREFWPLLGDTASQETAGARLVDASTERIELCVRIQNGSDPGTLIVGSIPVPLHAIERGLYVSGVRYRAFVPQPGLHETLPAIDPVEVVWMRNGRSVMLALHGWNPSGGGYDGVPVDALEAARRRAERVIVRNDGSALGGLAKVVHAEPRTERRARFTIDLRNPLRS